MMETKIRYATHFPIKCSLEEQAEAQARLRDLCYGPANAAFLEERARMEAQNAMDDFRRSGQAHHWMWAV